MPVKNEKKLDESWWAALNGHLRLYSKLKVPGRRCRLKQAKSRCYKVVENFRF